MLSFAKCKPERAFCPPTKTGLLENRSGSADVLQPDVWLAPLPFSVKMWPEFRGCSVRVLAAEKSGLFLGFTGFFAPFRVRYLSYPCPHEDLSVSLVAVVELAGVYEFA